jgi:osmotically-inducible protein OsmY
VFPTSTTSPPQSIAVTGPARDRQTLDRARQRLGQSGYHQHRRVAFDFHEGVLTLCGIVSSFFLKQLAHVLVANVEGVDEVANRLEVQYPAASYGM